MLSKNIALHSVLSTQSSVLFPWRFSLAQSKRKGGCGLIVLLVVLGGAALVYMYFRSTREERKLPPPSGGELQVHVLDVGQGDSILVISPEGKTVLVDAGEPGDGKIVLGAMKRLGVNQIDLFIATHAHADHIGAADEVIRATAVRRVLDSGVAPPHRASTDGTNSTANKATRTLMRRRDRNATLPTTKSYADFLESVEQRGAEFVRAEPGQTFDLGGGAVLTVLAPMQPFFTKDQLRSGGNEPNANSVVARLDYGHFSMVLTGDAEAQTEDRLISQGARLGGKVLKVGHHGSKYATSERFIQNVKPEVAVISDGASNRYGHPSQEVLDRLRAAGVRVYRTDLQGEISITTRGEGYEVRTAKEASGDLWAGREPQRDDSSRSGFISYGDFGPPPKQPTEGTAQRATGDK